MKRSKIFLGATTAILAVVGVAAAKRFAGTTRFYITSGGKYCKSQSNLQCVKSANTLDPICTTTIGDPGTTFNLYTKGPAGVIVFNPTKDRCLIPLTYNTTVR